MEINNLPPFYVGQKVVCIQSHSRGHFKKGDVFTVKSVLKPCCNWTIDIGFRSSYDLMRCSCLNTYPYNGHYLAAAFRPLEELKPPLLTFEKIKEVEKEELLILN